MVENLTGTLFIDDDTLQGLSRGEFFGRHTWDLFTPSLRPLNYVDGCSRVGLDERESQFICALYSTRGKGSGSNYYFQLQHTGHIILHGL